MKSKTVGRLGLTALGVVAAVAIACDGGSDDDGIDEAASTGGFGFEEGAPADADGSFGRELDALLGEKGDAGTSASAAEEPPRQSAADSAAGGGSAPVPGSPAGTAQTVDRKIIQTASLQLQVEEVGVGFEEVGRIATAAGGFVASSSFTYRDGDEEELKRRQVASVTVRVPAETYTSVLGQLRGLAETVDYEESNASDVTEEFTDLQSRLRNLEATETQLLTLLARAETISDILTVQDRLNVVRGEIEYVQGRLQLINDLTDLATITVHLRPVAGAPATPDGDDVNLGETISEAWDDSLTFLGNIAEGVLTVVVFAWWLAVITVPAAAVWAATRRRADGPASEHPM